jgi:hypothetical protein
MHVSKLSKLSYRYLYNPKGQGDVERSKSRWKCQFQNIGTGFQHPIPDLKEEEDEENDEREGEINGLL